MTCCPPRYEERQRAAAHGPTQWIYYAMLTTPFGLIAYGFFGRYEFIFTGAVLLAVCAYWGALRRRQTMTIEVHDDDLRILHTGHGTRPPTMVPLSSVRSAKVQAAGLSALTQPSFSQWHTNVFGLQVRGFVTVDVPGIGDIHVGSLDPQALLAALEAARQERRKRAAP